MRKKNNDSVIIFGVTMILSDLDILLLSFVADHPQCTITDIIKGVFTVEDTDHFKKLDNRVRARLKIMEKEELVTSIDGYDPKRYQVNSSLVFKGHGELSCLDIEGHMRAIKLDEFIVVVGPQNRISIRPLHEDVWEKG